ncbi:BCD family MFS transporter [Alsobacter sp. KACC 23698]|uniref:BCD family MFS transporter n=1 Tax=Alsobacter sp. KACC 23698 TaxID=3149229 RepID=A0AAU7JEJ0_9HYPH
MIGAPLGWLGIIRIGLVQTALGAIVVLMTSTINRVMVVELALPAIAPGLLVGLHYGVQVLRPRWGYGSDIGGRRTPWIIGGMAGLALGAVGAAAGTALAGVSPAWGLAVATLSFLAIGVGVGAAGTSLLALLASQVEPRIRAGAAATVWIMMIAGFAISAPLAGHFLDPFSPARLVGVTAAVAAVAFVVATLAILGVEPARGPAPSSAPAPGEAPAPRPSFGAALRDVWADARSRRFAIFIFVSMLAYSAQELVLEPFSGVVFGLTPGGSTKLSGVQHSGVLFGMIAVSLVAARGRGRWYGSLRAWTVLGCAASAVPLVGLAGAGLAGPDFPLRPCVFALGFFNGVFAVAAIGSMMELANGAPSARQGTHMGVWGAAQAVAFGLGGLCGAAAVDLARGLVASPTSAYGVVFLCEAALFLASAVLAASLGRASQAVRPSAPLQARSEGAAA